jgi:hypothetical protein
MALVDLNNCLFCGLELTEANRTREDVFPRWLQREYGIAEMALTLLNGAEIRYRQLVVPACQVCNNVHASQLEQRVKEDRATDQDMWIWMLKLQLGTLAFETQVPWIKDRRDPRSAEPIMDASVMDLGFLHALFDTLKVEHPQYEPNPLGSVFSFPTDRAEFFYTDNLYRHPASRHDHNYSASCICIHGQCWIALFDDAGNVRRSVIPDELAQLVEAGHDPVLLYPDLIYQRARFDYMPRTLVLGRPDGPASAVAFLPPMHAVPVLDHDDDVQRLFRTAFLNVAPVMRPVDDPDAQSSREPAEPGS